MNFGDCLVEKTAALNYKSIYVRLCLTLSRLRVQNFLPVCKFQNISVKFCLPIIIQFIFECDCLQAVKRLAT